MSALEEYDSSGLMVVVPDPTGAGGLAINDNFKAIADSLAGKSDKPSGVSAGDLLTVDGSENLVSSGKTTNDLRGLLPVGGVIAWLKSYTNTPSLPTGYVECNGQSLSDSGSVYNGQTIPNLNTSTKRFLRGSSTSGTTGGSELHSHTVTTCSPVVGSGSTSLTTLASGTTSSVSTLPSYYEVVWVMRVK